MFKPYQLCESTYLPLCLSRPLLILHTVEWPQRGRSSCTGRLVAGENLLHNAYYSKLMQEHEPRGPHHLQQACLTTKHAISSPSLSSELTASTASTGISSNVPKFLAISFFIDLLSAMLLWSPPLKSRQFLREHLYELSSN